VIGADMNVMLLNAESFYKDFDRESLMKQGLIKTKGKGSRMPMIIDEQESRITCIKIDSDEEFIAAGLDSGKIMLYRTELIFGKFSLIEFLRHEKEVNDMYFFIKENIKMLIVACSDTKLSVISLDE